MKERFFSRREFVKAVGAASVGSLVGAGCVSRRNAVSLSQAGLSGQTGMPPGRAENLDEGWRLWPDTRAAWENDTLYLPEDLKLADLPVNAPTGGWSVLNEPNGIALTLPATVEEHLAELFPATNPAPDGIIRGDLKKGNAFYRGISWWWRRFNSPALAAGQRAMIRFRGARLRSEVYCNGKLCGYSILTELPFGADVTEALDANGENLLAVRITNPGGFLDWNDLGSLIQWGPQSLPGSHAFGGLDRQIVLEVRDPVHVNDLAVFNRSALHSVRLRLEVASIGPDYDGPVEIKITHEGKTVWNGKIHATVSAGKIEVIEQDVTLADAVPWSLENPAKYQAHAWLPGHNCSGCTTAFGFRWLAAEGIGHDAKLRFNGRRIVLRSAISWGYWAPSGLWPTREMAGKEVDTAKELGLTCLQSHRNLAKPEVLDLQDEKGLLRWEEPGAGAKEFDPTAHNAKGFPPTKGPIDTSGKGGEPQGFVERYEWARILAMIRRDRSHPCLIIYTVQNEQAPDLHNPRIFALLRKMRETDPSRIILLHSGGTPQNQAYFLPWDDTVHHDNGTGFSGWLDNHTANLNPGGWQDADYRDPEHFLYRSCPSSWAKEFHPDEMQLPYFRSANRSEILVWGEMGGVGVPDDHRQIAEWYKKQNLPGYDRLYHERIAAGYEKFLDASGFRSDFPTSSDVFRAVGEKSYFFWQKALEQGRMDNTADYLVVSGWESTTIDNHSGIVDMHRNPRCNLAIFRQATLPELLVVRPRGYILATTERAVVDVFLINETGRQGAHRLTLIGRGADGAKLGETTVTVHVMGGEVFGQLLHAGWECNLSGPGVTTFEANLSPVGGGSPVLRRAEKIQVVSLDPPSDRRTVGVTDASGVLARTFARLGVSLVAPNLARTIVYLAEGRRHSALPLLFESVAREGLRLVICANAGDDARTVAQMLAARGIIQFEGNLGGGDHAWFGSWYFVRRHPLFNGLPTGCAMDWRYQAVANNLSDGLLMNAPGMQIAAAYGRYDEARVGVGAAVIPVGKGEVVLFSLPALNQALVGNAAGARTGGMPSSPAIYAKEALAGEVVGIHPLVAQRLLLNGIARHLRTPR